MKKIDSKNNAAAYLWLAIISDNAFTLPMWARCLMWASVAMEWVAVVAIVIVNRLMESDK